MSDEEIGVLFVQYMTVEMNLIDDQMMDYEHPQYSRKFEKKIKRLIRAGKSFDGHVTVYNVVRRVAIFVVIVLSLAVANEASARIVGINPWDMLITYISEYRMNRVELMGQKNINNELPTPVSDIPTFVPEGYQVYD